MGKEWAGNENIKINMNTNEWKRINWLLETSRKPDSYRNQSDKNKAKKDQYMAQFTFLLLVYDEAEHGGDFSCIKLVCVGVCKLYTVNASKNDAIKHKNEMRERWKENERVKKTLRARTKSKNAKR